MKNRKENKNIKKNNTGTKNKKSKKEKQNRNIINFNSSSILMKKKIDEAFQSHDEDLKFYGIKSIKLSVIKNAHFFKDKVTEFLGHCELPYIEAMIDGSVRFLWDFSIHPVKQLEFCIYSDKITVLAEDKLGKPNLSAYKEFTFSSENREIPELALDCLIHFLSRKKNRQQLEAKKKAFKKKGK